MKSSKQDKGSATDGAPEAASKEAASKQETCFSLGESADKFTGSKDNRLRRYIRIYDTDKWDMIDKIMSLPEYKSLNKVINEALFYGLPILTKELFGEVEISEEKETPLTKREQSEREIKRELDLIEKLLREAILNVTINKSILSSLFNAKISERKGRTIKSDFDYGLLSDTPDYLQGYELDEIRKLNGGKRK